MQNGRSRLVRRGRALRTPRGALLLWALGTLGVLAAVAMSGDIALLVFIADRELLVLVVESATVYGLWAWRSGILGAAKAMVEQKVWPWPVTFHVQSIRWSL